MKRSDSTSGACQRFSSRWTDRSERRERAADSRFYRAVNGGSGVVDRIAERRARDVTTHGEWVRQHRGSTLVGRAISWATGGVKGTLAALVAGGDP